MRVMIPYTIDEDVLESSSIDIDDDGYPEWSATRSVAQKLLVSAYTPKLATYSIDSNGRVHQVQQIQATAFSQFAPMIDTSINQSYVVSGTVYTATKNLNLYKFEEGLFAFVTNGFPKDSVEAMFLSLGEDIICLSSGTDGFEPRFNGLRMFRLVGGKMVHVSLHGNLRNIKNVMGMKWSDDGRYFMVAHQVEGDFITGSSILSLYEKDHSGSFSLIWRDDSLTYESGHHMNIFFWDDLFYIAHSGGFSFLDIESLVLTNVATSEPPNCLSLNLVSGLIAVTTYNIASDRLLIYQKNSVGTWEAMTNPTQPPSSSWGCEWDKAGTYLYVTHNGTPGITIYKRNLSTNALSIVTSPVGTGSIVDGRNLKLLRGFDGYMTGEVVYKGTSLFESAVDENTTNPDNLLLHPIVHWTEIGSVNRWRMFDDFGNTYSEADNSIVVVLVPDKAGADSVAWFDVTSDTIKVDRLSAANAVLWTSTVDLDDRYKEDYKASGVLDLDQKLIAGEKIRITFTNTTKKVQVGKVIFGEVESLGDAQWGVEAKVISHSDKRTDAFGRTFLRVVPSAKEIRAEGVISDADGVFSILRKVESLPCAWDFNGDNTSFSSLVGYGIYDDHGIVWHGTNYIKLRMTILGLI